MERMIEEQRMKEEMKVNLVEDEINIDVRYVKKLVENRMKMVIDSGVPVSLVSHKWLKDYLENARVLEKQVERGANNRKFWLGKTLYTSEEKVVIPIVMRMEDDDFVKKSVAVNVIPGEEIGFSVWRQNT